MDGGVGDAEGHLRDHAALLGEDDRILEVAVVVEAAERAGDIGALFCLYLIHEAPDIPLFCLYLIHEAPDIPRDWIHTEGVKASFEHVCLYADFVEGCGPGSYGLVGVLSEEEVHLLERSSVGLDPVETAHVDDDGSDLNKLVNPRDV